MSEVADRLRGAVRWSMASRCARQASYGLLGVEPTPFTARESGRMARGRDAGHYFARQMAAKHGEENVIFEMGVPWPAPPALPVGELHIDVGLISERIAIEAKSSIYVDSMYDAAVIQLAGAVKAKRGRAAAVSDWMEMERERGISISTSVMQFPYRGLQMNLRPFSDR